MAVWAFALSVANATLDLNEDSLSDVWQSFYTEASGTLDADFDGDGWSNLEEGLARTNPHDIDSSLELSIKPSAGALAESHQNLSWGSEFGLRYSVQEGDLINDWETATGEDQAIIGTGSELGVDLPLPTVSGEPRFWRLAALGTVADSDGDLLDAWEENQLGSHPGTSDTDNDGILDGKDFAYLAGPTTYSPAGLGVPSTGELAGKLVRYSQEGVPVAIRAFGVNYFDGFLRYIRESDDRSFVAGFEYLAARNIPVARVLVGGFWPVDWNLYFADKAEYYRRLDDFVEQAERHEIGLILTLFWHIATVGDVVQDAVDAGYLTPGVDFVPPQPLNLDAEGNPTYDEYRTAIGRAESGSTAFIAYVTQEVVNRYKTSPAIWGWEFSNELNLSVDLPNINAFRPKERPNLQKNLSRDPSSVPAYESKDDFERADAQFAKEHFASLVRSLDPWRFISSGDSRPRPSAYNNWQSHTFGLSSRAELAQVIPVDNPNGYDSVSVHVYANNETYFSDSPSVALTFETGDYASYFDYLMEQSESLNKPLFVGEWGAIGDGTTAAERTTFHRMLQALIDEEVQLSLLWSFDNANAGQSTQWWVNPGTEKEYQLTNEDPDLWDLEQANTLHGRW